MDKFKNMTLQQIFDYPNKIVEIYPNHKSIGAFDDFVIYRGGTAPHAPICVSGSNRLCGYWETLSELVEWACDVHSVDVNDILIVQERNDARIAYDFQELLETEEEILNA